MGKPGVLSLYTGAGGIDLGLEAAGFETRAAVEFDADCCRTLRKNRPAWQLFERSIFDISTAELLSAASVRSGELDLVAGGPPCQPFSKSGYWARGDALRLLDPRADTLAAYLRVVEECLPKAFVLENVGGIAFDGKDEGLRLLLSRIEGINKRHGTRYKPRYQVLNSAEHGVPQIRERFVLVAARDGTEFQFPRPAFTEATGNELLPSLKPFRTAWDALADVRPDRDEDLTVRGKWAELLPSIPEGENYLWHTERRGGLPLFGWRRRFWTFLLKLAKARPSWTIQAQPGPAVGPFHWENRRLSARELLRLQTFPDAFEIVGGRTSLQRQLGNAVPSLLMEVLGRELRKQVFGLRTSGPLRLLPPDRSPVPPPEQVAAVPRKFKKLAGEHEAHPGTGQGYSARQREGQKPAPEQTAA